MLTRGGRYAGPAGDKQSMIVSDPASLAELHRFCREGRLYDVERWITAGNPLQLAEEIRPKGRRTTSALRISLESGNHSLTLLLLRSGFDPNLESESPLNIGLRTRRWDLLDLLLEWQADPHRVDLETLFGTYNSDLYERFRTLGVDMTTGHALAETLAYHTSNKPLFGFAKRHREHNPGIQAELDAALVYHAGEGNVKGVAMCLWSGADPHSSAFDLRYGWSYEPETEEDEDTGVSAVYQACFRGDANILPKLGPDPARDDFEDLYRIAGSGAIIEILAASALPENVGAVIEAHLSWYSFGFDERGSHTLRRLIELGARWKDSTEDEIRYIRRSLLKIPDYQFTDIVRLFATDEYVAPDILHELGRTPAMRARMKEVGFIPPKTEDPQRVHYRPTGSREVLKKFGIKIPTPPKPKVGLPRIVHVGPHRSDKREIRLDRGELFELVWSRPISKIAEEWGMSGTSLAKACGRLKIPVPPRGFWARRASGQTVPRPRLPALPTGQAEEIVIRATRD